MSVRLSFIRRDLRQGLRLGAGLLLLGLLGGCAGAPYVDSSYMEHQSGRVRICYAPSTTPPAKVQAMAEEVCQKYHRTAVHWLTQPNQCSWTDPYLATFYCAARPGEPPPPELPVRHAPMRHETYSE